MYIILAIAAMLTLLVGGVQVLDISKGNVDDLLASFFE